MNQTRIKRSVSDAAAIAGLLGELGYPATAEDAARRLRLYSTADSRILVAEAASGTVVGFASLHLTPMLHADGLWCRVTALVVTDGWRNRGVGGRLMAAAETWARSAGCVRMELTSGDHRQQAHDFYLRSGFHIHNKRFLKSL